MNIYNLKEKNAFLREVVILEYKEWEKKINNKVEFEEKINRKMEKIKAMFDNPHFCKLVLVDNEELIGFISIFPSDGEERQDLSPWYATMYVKKEYRGNGYSKILNDAILQEARKRKIKKLYLKTDLENYYEKFGAKYIEKLKNGEKLYYIDL